MWGLWLYNIAGVDGYTILLLMVIQSWGDGCTIGGEGLWTL